MGRVGYALAEVIQEHAAGNPDAACATAIQLYKAVCQMAVDQGDWRAAWPLTFLDDPYLTPQHTSANELDVVGGMLKAKADLKQKVYGKGGGGQQQGAEEDEEGEEDRPRRRNRNKNRDQKREKGEGKGDDGRDARPGDRT